MPAAKARPAAYHHGNLRDTLIALASARIAKAGTADFTLRELAAEAGVTHVATYRHFASREALLAAIAADGYRRLQAQEAAAQEALGADHWARLLVLSETYLRFMIDTPGHFHVMFAHRWSDDATYDEAIAAQAESFALLERSVADCQAAGVLPAGAPSRLTAAMLGVTHGLASLWLSGQLDIVMPARRRADRFILETLKASFEAFRDSDPDLWRAK
jgi:AcrR family transcriptional regulator